MYLWTRKSEINFGRHPDQEESGSEVRNYTPDPDRIRLGEVLRCPSALVMELTSCDPQRN